MGKINQKQNGNCVSSGSGTSYLCLWGGGWVKTEKGGGLGRETGTTGRKETRWEFFLKFGLLVCARRGLVDGDGVSRWGVGASRGSLSRLHDGQPAARTDGWWSATRSETFNLKKKKKSWGLLYIWLYEQQNIFFKQFLQNASNTMEI